jgi:uncharacterized protein YggE
MRRALLLALPALPIALPARAQETKLRLAETGTARRMPDEIVAQLRAEARAANAAAAQEAVNRAMAAALELARGVAGLRATTGRAGAYRSERPNAAPEWVAQQALTLRAAGEPAPLLALVGQLQGQGLAISDLSWQLSDALAREARDEATREALRLVRARADLVARELGLRVAALREVALDAQEAGRPMPRAAAMAVAAARDAAPAVSAPDEILVSVTSSAELTLAP